MDEIKLDVKEQGEVDTTGNQRSDQVIMTTVIRNFRQERLRDVSRV